MIVVNIARALSSAIVGNIAEEKRKDMKKNVFGIVTRGFAARRDSPTTRLRRLNLACRESRE